jgi:hypothetical protein
MEDSPPKPRRWEARYAKPVKKYDGARLFGITEPKIGAAFGFMVSYWTQVEEQMILLLGQLITGKQNNDWHVQDTSRLIFRSIVSETARIKIMRALLEDAPQNVNMGSEFDAVLDEFSSLNSQRNKYVHGLWWTEPKSLDVLLTNPTDHPIKSYTPHVVTLKEIQDILQRMRKLHGAISRCLNPPQS